MKDIYAYSKDPFATLSHKIHPVFSSLSEMLSNKDYYGDKIYNEDDPMVRQLGDRFKFISEQFEPFSVRNYQQRRQAEGSVGESVQSFFGITPAPSSVDQSKAEELMSKYIREKLPVGGRTQKEVERSKLIHDLVQRKRNGEDVKNDIVQAIKSGTLTYKQAMNIYRTAKENPSLNSFKRLTANEAQKVYKLGTLEEKRLWKYSLMQKLYNAGIKIDQNML